MQLDIDNETQTDALAVPLLLSQIEAAERLRERLPGWTATERAFEELQRALPGHSCEAVLVKAAAIDRLYATNVRGQAIHQVVCRIAEVMLMPPEDPVAVVEAIIAAPGVGKHYRSFASKFAHFFIEPERFPIYDEFCRRQTARHLGKAQAKSYCVFFQDICDLRRLSGLSCSLRALDHYLWLAGQYREWHRKHGEVDMNAEVRALFENPPSEVQRELEALCPDIGDDFPL